ncbi:MAG: ferredoxin family protein [Anaerolineales bacterium]|jgi:ferredoxin
MTHIITSLCLRDGGCVDVCPVECIIAGKPQDQWPWYYIDPETCIDCGACVPECPFGAIFPEDEVPVGYQAKGGERVSRPEGSSVYEGNNHNGESVHIDHTVVLNPGQVVDLRPDSEPNYKFFKEGPGYSAR